MTFDLHCHSNASDGSLSPSDLLYRATSQGVTTLSITDHDTMSAYEEIDDGALHRINLVPGIEFSTRWGKTGIHIVGLNLDLDSERLRESVRLQTAARRERAIRIAENLAKLGIETPLCEVQNLAGGNYIGRPHFARYLVNRGWAKDTKQAFKRYLGAGKAGDVKFLWAPYEQVVGWIHESGGVAVLAHPAKYTLGRTRLGMLFDDFKDAGGDAVEVISGRQTQDLTDQFAKMCEARGLRASLGSDFHHPDQSWADLGRIPGLPKRCKPVWEDW